MDPLTHALAGAAVGWAVGGRRRGKRALLVGAAAGLLPDVDVFIRSASDPLLAIEHHRGFTHSLLFVPVGGAIAALALGGRAALLAGIAAYASHPLLDAATTYGTQLFWPFSRTRVGLDIISILDPLFTLIVLAAVIAALRNARRAVHVALIMAVAWLAIGFVQRERALSAQARLAMQRGHRVDRGEVFPTVGNTLVWRSLYATNGMLRMDRIRVPWLGAVTYASGDAVPIARPDGNARDFARFAWFSGGWLARDPRDASIIGDARYSLHADRYVPVWGIRSRGGSTEWVNRARERKVSLRESWNEIYGVTPSRRIN